MGLLKPAETLHLYLNTPPPPPKEDILLNNLPDFLRACLLYLIKLSAGVKTYLKVVKNDKNLFLRMFYLQVSHKTQ